MWFLFDPKCVKFSHENFEIVFFIEKFQKLYPESFTFVKLILFVHYKIYP